MCLGIPGEVVGLVEGRTDVAVVAVGGVKRKINVGLLADDPPVCGDWVLIHVGFAMAKIDEAQAAAELEFLAGLGESYEDELAALRDSGTG